MTSNLHQIVVTVNEQIKTDQVRRALSEERANPLRRYAQLVESFRNEDGKPRQRTVCTLGRLEDGAEVDTLIASLQSSPPRIVYHPASAIDKTAVA
jgi:hypothetical protein